MLEAYTRLPAFADFGRLNDPSLYEPLPEGWWIGVADVVDSTGAIASGRYKSVNMAGAAVIAAVKNALGGRDFPFVFGGDGAGFALPDEHRETARQALAATAAWVRADLDLELRVGLVPLADIRAAGLDVRVARFAPSENVTYAMFSGGGLAFAEAALKRGLHRVEEAPAGTRPDLSGLSCRFEPVRAARGIILSVLVVPARGGDDPAFRENLGRLVRLIEENPGEASKPFPPAGPPLAWPPEGIELEARATRGPGQSLALRRAGLYLRTLLAHLVFRARIPVGGFEPDLYRRETVANADSRKYDDGLRLTLDCTPGFADRVERLLGAAEAEGALRYGLHRQDAAVMTCFTPSVTAHDHVHFIDGAAGGYASAARRLKGAGARLPASDPAAPGSREG